MCFVSELSGSHQTNIVTTNNELAVASYLTSEA